MLKLERLKNSEKVEVRFLARNRMFDRPLQRALLYSFLFHSLLFTLFRIQYGNLDARDEVRPQPIQVAIEQEYDANGTIADVVEEEKTQLMPFDKNETPEFPVFDKEKAIFELLCSQKESSFKELSFLGSEILQLGEQKIDWCERLYPLHLKLSHSLHKLELIEDGSLLFRPKRSMDRTSEFQLTLAHYSISYHVSVDGATGKIILSSRKKELLDKKLQFLADRLLEKIRFYPFEKKEVKGRISLVFHASGDDVEAMLQ